jgi:sugar phosphate permease
VRPTKIRHVVLWLTVAAYMITYMDRVVISAAVPLIQKELAIDNASMGVILGAFRWGYALFQIPGGWLGDLIGPRKALTMIVIWWSVFTSLTAVSWGVVSMIVFRFLFGVGEAGAFPIATRSLSRWMLPGERGYAQGITHAGSRLGAAITPPVVTAIMLAWGWRAAFWVFGGVGALWALVWYWYYRDRPSEHSSVNAQELELIQRQTGAGPKPGQSPGIPWRVIFSSPTLWTLCTMYFCYSYCLAIYLDWFPKYLNQARGLNIKTMGMYASLPLFAGTLGDFLGGWISDRLAHKRGLKTGRRVVAVAGFLLAAAGIVPAVLSQSPERCVAFTCLAFFGLEVTVGVSWAVPLDIGGDYAGSVSAVMNTCGNIGGAISSTSLGFLVQAFGWETPFLAAAVACALAAVLFSRIDATRRIFQEA